MRKPDFVIGGHDNPYMLRWWVIPRNRWFNVYLHKILREDDDRALHDHPWWNVSILLRGAYIEVRPDVKAAATPFTRIADMPVIRALRRAGSVVFRKPSTAHRLELLTVNGQRQPVWSLFITGPRVREWGFHCSHGWREWRDFVASDDPGSIGRGCE
jgi:hypothetical protein